MRGVDGSIEQAEEGKAGGKTGIMPQLIVHCTGAELIDRLLQLIQRVAGRDSG